jgi:DNA-binding NtrC family response regulator
MISPLESASRLPQLLGTSAEIADLKEQIATAARTSAKVLILGETGVGKEVVARLLHHHSARASRPFVPVNCSGIPETLLESELFGHRKGSFTGAYRDKIGLVRQADRGTLFLDELGEMSLRMQAVLLRFTETGEIQEVGTDGPTGRADVRLITATNRDLRTRIAEGAFREDLFYRLNVIQIHIPPLRERGEDILLLMRHYVKVAAAAHRMREPEFTPEATAVLGAYRWPGNVRELRNIAERLVLQDRPRPLRPDDLPPEVRLRTASGAGYIVSRDAAIPAAIAVSAAAPVVIAAAPAQPAPLDQLWNRMANGEDFWTVVHRAFKARELTRTDLSRLIDRGLQETRGSYRALLGVFGLPQTDYKRFHAFLYQQQCNLPVASYRRAGLDLRLIDLPADSVTPPSSPPS